MEFLSLHEPIPVPGGRLRRTDALALSVALHLLALLLFLYLPQHLPESVLAFFRSTPASSSPLASEAMPAARPTPSTPLQQPHIPVKFAYVRLPNDVAAPKNPNSPLLSDKNRRARQEMPTPPNARLLSIDPHSEGDSLERVRPDPSRPEGPESPDRPEPQPAGGAGGAVGGTAGPEVARGAQGTANGPGAPAARGSGLLAQKEGGPGGAVEPPRPGSGPGQGTSNDPQESLKRALTDVKTGEYKFIFNNPAYLRGGSYGTMSFDTQDFPWGDYARRLYVIIRNNWIARLPLAYREGIRGYVCWKMIIEKGGTISQILMLKPSSVPPFDRAAADAIRASDPLPPLPEAFPDPREGVTFCFYYNMVPGEAE